MSQPVLVLLVAGAAFRLWRLLAHDSLFDSQRERFYTRFPPDAAWARHRAIVLAATGGPALKPSAVYPPSKVGILIDCAWCAGWWVTGLVVLAVWLWCGLRYPLLVWPAASTIVGFLGKLNG